MLSLLSPLLSSQFTQGAKYGNVGEYWKNKKSKDEDYHSHQYITFTETLYYTPIICTMRVYVYITRHVFENS